MSILLQTTNLIAAAAYVVIVALVIAELRRLRIGVPGVVVVLLAYFTLRVVDLVAAPDPLFGYSPIVDAATDLGIIAVLLVLVLHARRLARAALAVVSEGKLRVAEYERARRDYSVAVHAKVAGPLSVISGAAQSLQESPGDPAANQQLVALIEESARALRTVSQELEAARSPRPDGST